MLLCLSPNIISLASRCTYLTLWETMDLNNLTCITILVYALNLVSRRRAAGSVGVPKL